MKFLVTTRIEVLNTARANGEQVVMLDGTIPEYKKGKYSDDIHLDHHRVDGPPVQIYEVNSMDYQHVADDAIICTTQVDADACVAAAYLLYGKFVEGYGSNPEVLPNPEVTKKLIAIAWDCDHLAVPDSLSHYADFAAQAVAAMKQNSEFLVKELNLPVNRKEWSLENKEEYASLAFERGTMQLISAMKGECDFPGENGEAQEYWDNCEKIKLQMIEENRVQVYRDCLIIYCVDMGGKYIDPRIPHWIAKQLKLKCEYPITVTSRSVYKDNVYQGTSYTLGVIPLHPRIDEINYNEKTFEALTEAEKRFNPQFDSWGGRKTVGGSSWNCVSKLTDEHVIDIALKCNFGI